jgi:hypothetical protein
MSDASEAKGLAEELVGSLKPNDIIQFERFGYCRIDKINPFTAYFTHI